jgi:hypothetical protein
MTISFEVLESLPDLVVAPEQQVLRKTKGVGPWGWVWGTSPMATAASCSYISRIFVRGIFSASG